MTRECFSGQQSVHIEASGHKALHSLLEVFTAVPLPGLHCCGNGGSKRRNASRSDIHLTVRHVNWARAHLRRSEQMGRGAGFLVPCRRSLPSYWVLSSMIMFAPMVSTEQLTEVLNVLTPAGPVDIFSCSRDCVRSPCRIHFDAKARDAKFPGNIGALTCAGHVVAMYVS